MDPKEMKETPSKKAKKIETESSENPTTEAEQIMKTVDDGQKNLRKKNGKGIRALLSNLLIVCGLLLIAVPLVLTYVNTKQKDDIIDQFLAEAEQAVTDSEAISDEEIVSVYPQNTVVPEPTSTPNPAETPIPASTEESPSATPDAPPQPTKNPTMSKEEIQKRMTGVLTIKKIDVKMVIMDGVDDETLRVAAGRMTNTGNFDEIGNVVLAGHRSYTLGKYFNRLDELEPGDEIVVQTKTKTLKYIIYKKLIVEPDDLSITNKNGTDKILTLFTCHPVVIADHRLVVHAKQVE